MGAVLSFKPSSGNHSSAHVTTPRIGRDDVVVVILLVAGWLTVSVWLFDSIARASATSLVH